MTGGDILERAAPGDAVRLAYGPEPDQFGDLRVPVGSGPHPVSIVIHGGYWRSRYGLDYMGHAAEALRREGIASWNVEYRRVGNPGGGWPGTLEDLVGAAAYLHEVSDRFNLDLDRIVAIGHSAGGHLASWLASARQSAALDPDPSRVVPPLLGVIPLAGVLDLRRAWELGLSNMAVVGLLGGSPEEVPGRYAAASPVELLPTGLYHVLVHGTADEDVPFELSQRYFDAAASAGDSVDLISLEGEDHFCLVDPDSHVWPTVLQAVGRVLEPKS